MVTGQSLVLYSRLHLVLHNQLCLRLVLVMIITTAFILHVPSIVLLYYSQAEPGREPNMMWPWILYENIQATGFCIQDLVISGLYIKNLFSIFSLQGCLYPHKIRGMRRHLLLVNIMLILLDILAILVGYAALHTYEKSGLYWRFDVLYSIGAAFRGFVYSVKLKVEFSILNSLVDLTRDPIN
ncbi:hypothetical protein VFPPC_12636 [Pochonia chlamydosporia 170]|uniref:DUF7703 domain-containing protein n=1 Tax=Pochonia chlamydosporia 170 TaxID=1380566 RepID=A0A179EVQ6_METCM|nr:hypothetical protein VFPPC_12636 [Pochonia chlamydosporia 170]OAQ57278.2 hypothetical protein VFPPC_12636 [Pochonia chlamydosporia 170]